MGWAVLCSRCAHLVDGEHVEVGDIVLLGELDPGAALLLVDQLADVLVDKLALSEEDEKEEKKKSSLIKLTSHGTA